VESFYNSKLRLYGWVELNTRYNNVLLPGMQSVAIKDKQKRKPLTGHFSDRLIDEMTDTLKAGPHVILSQTRRGCYPIVECRTCGVSPQCPNCDVSLTYHQYKDQLRCHYCGYHAVMIKACEACGSLDLDNKGFGTQQVEEEVKELFPDYKVARMDMDT